jgi:RNA polymerase sigma-70 factor (ECF subfamily)
MATERTDTELVKGIALRDESAFEEIVARYGSKVLNLALRITRNQEDAEEILQDVFITVFTKVNSFEHKSQFSSWLYRVTMNSSFMKIRSRNRRRAVYLEEIEPSTKLNWVGNRTEMFDDQGAPRGIQSYLHSSRYRWAFERCGWKGAAPLHPRG